MIGADFSRFTSVEHLREFLENELGEEKIMKAYPILKEFVRFYFWKISQIFNREITYFSKRRLMN